jgi:5'-3' exonuclease
MENKRVIVIDGTNIQFIAIFNYMNQFNTIPCTWTFMSMLCGYLRRLEVTLDDLIILGLDFGSWRKAEEKKYKAQRQEFRESYKPPEWWEARYKEFNDLYEKIKLALPIHIIKIYMRECDDIASVCCRVYRDKEIILISSDKDWEQLAYYENVKVFSPRSKKFKDIKNPMKILLDKINKGDISDNLTEKVSTEAEFEHRKKLVSLIELPLEIEQPIKEELAKIMPRNLYLHKIPFKSIQNKFKAIYKLED